MKNLSKILFSLVAVLLFLVGCSQSESGEETVQEDNEQTENKAVQEDADENTEQAAEDSEVDEDTIGVAEEFIEQLSQGQYEVATEKFDETMANSLGSEDLQALWEGLEEQLGEFIDYEYDRTEAVENYQVVIINGVFNNADVAFQVTVDENLEIAGFYI